jgi:hypothetical protein
MLIRHCQLDAGRNAPQTPRRGEPDFWAMITTSRAPRGFALNTGVNRDQSPTLVDRHGSGQPRNIKPRDKADSATRYHNKLAGAAGAGFFRLWHCQRARAAYISALREIVCLASRAGGFMRSPAWPTPRRVASMFLTALSTTAAVHQFGSFRGAIFTRARATTDTFYTIQKRVSLGRSGNPSVANLPSPPPPRQVGGARFRIDPGRTDWRSRPHINDLLSTVMSLDGGRVDCSATPPTHRPSNRWALTGRPLFLWVGGSAVQ